MSSSAVVSLFDDDTINRRMTAPTVSVPSFSMSSASLFPEFHHGDGNRKFDAALLFHHTAHKSHHATSFKTAGDAAAASRQASTSHPDSRGDTDGNCQRFFDPSNLFQPHTSAPTVSGFVAQVAAAAPPVGHVAPAPIAIPPSSVDSNESSPSDLGFDEFDEMLSHIPLFDDDNLELDQVQPTPIASLSISTTIAVPAKVEIDLKIAALTAITKQNATTKATTGNNVKTGRKVAGAKRTRKYQTGQWDNRYTELLHFQGQHGHMFVPHSYPANQKLAQWVKRQRYQHKLKYSGHHSTLSDERESILNKSGFIWDSHAASWQEQFELLQQFSVTFGHCNVPTRYHGSTALNVWCKHQRKQYKLFATGKPSTLNAKRLECLNSIGFNWNPRSKNISCG